MSSIRKRAPTYPNHHERTTHIPSFRPAMSPALVPRIYGHSNWLVRRGGRLLFAVIRFPGVIQAVWLALLYRYASKRWCEKYCGVWEPAFPRAWTEFVLVLSIVPVLAGMQLVWLLGTACIRYLVDRRKTKSRHGNGRGSVAFNSEEADYMLHDRERESNSRPGSPISSASPSPYDRFLARIPSIWTVFWWLQVWLCVWVVWRGIWEFKHYEHEDDVRFKPALRDALSHNPRDRTGYAKGEKIYIAAAFFNNQDVLPYWTNTMLDVIAYLGPDNVYVSIVENNSNDRTPELLQDLNSKLDDLGVRRRILIGDKAVVKPEDTSYNNRIDFLADIRNRALEPLISEGGYDRVLFSNDIYIEPESVIELLETAGGEYDMACALDFGHFGAYDMWVLRDRVGHFAAGIWPYFFDAASYKAMKNGDPVPVLTCWNGIVVFDADPVLPVHLRSNRTISDKPLAHQPPPTHPLASTLGESPRVTPPLNFRSSPRGEGCFSSESFLLPYDMRRIFGMERIYVNPRVITGYAWHFYVWFKWVLRHRVVRWFVEKQYDGAWMQYARMIVGDADRAYTWDGGDCHPWWYEGTW